MTWAYRLALWEISYLIASSTGKDLVFIRQHNHELFVVFMFIFMIRSVAYKSLCMVDAYEPDICLICYEHIFFDMMLFVKLLFSYALKSVIVIRNSKRTTDFDKNEKSIFFFLFWMLDCIKDIIKSSY